MDNKLVSAIIPTYNSAKYIKEAVDSALSQTYKDIEITVVDDGSTDNTKNVLKKYIDNREIKYIYQENNGPASARNNGIRNSSGEFIAFLDADDTWKRGKLEKQMKLFDNKNVALVYSDMEFFGEKIKFKCYSEMFKRGMKRGRAYLDLILENFISTSTVVVRKDIFNNMGYFCEDVSLFSVEDYDMWLRIIKKYNVDFIDEPLVKYRIHNNQISRSRKESYKRLCAVYKKEFRRAPISFKAPILFKFLENKIKYIVSK